MPNLGTKYVCFSCQTKFYDLGREEAVCPKCSADQKDSDANSAPVTRSRRVAIENFDDEVAKKAVVISTDDDAEDAGDDEVADDSDHSDTPPLDEDSD